MKRLKARTNLDIERYLNMASTADLFQPIHVTVVIVGLIGAVLNTLLFYILYKNPSINKKCRVIYQNLAAVDIFNCLVIPLWNLRKFEKPDPKNGMLYLFFGATVNLSYMMLGLLSVVRVVIFRHQILYTQRLSHNMVRVMCVVCWFLLIAAGLGIWMCYLLGGNDEMGVLIGLMKFQSSATVIFTLVTLILLVVSGVIIQNMIYYMRRSGGRVLSESTALQIPASRFSQLITELSSATHTLFYFFWSILICSIYHIAFSASFVLCGPFYNSTRGYCQPLQTPALSDPNISYAIMLFFLCSMSITNSLILLNQRSFRATLRDLYRCILRVRGGFGQTQVNQNVGTSKSHAGKNEQIVQVMARTTTWTGYNQSIENME